MLRFHPVCIRSAFGTILLLIVALAICAVQCYGGAEYRIRDIGTLGGSYACAYDINDNGQIVGCADAAQGWSNAFVWQPGSTTLQPVFSGYASAINDHGQIAGCLSDSRAVLWQDGSSSFPFARSVDSFGSDINEDGWLVGGFEASDGLTHAFMWDGGTTVQDLGAYDGIDTGASAINDLGDVVGSTATGASGVKQYALLWQGGTSMQVLPTLGGSGTGASDINNRRQIVGQAFLTGDSVYHAVLWQNGSIQDIGTLGGSSAAWGINDRGQVVGRSYASSGTSHAFLWEAGSPMQDLGTLPGGTTSGAYAINELGQVVGYAIDADGYQHAVLWEPVPEPSSLATLGLTLAGLWAGRLRRRR